MRDLETVETVTVFSFFTDRVENLLYDLSSIGVAPFGPIISGAVLPTDEIVRVKKLSIRTSTDLV